ncbi:MAG TPA: nuclear transport factor 2 family protein [Methylomirabilota bacterium]|nr:nuclear transport factor 2 family protein [Methylomirabilota bacterium]
MGVHRHIILAWVVGSMLVAPLRTQGDDLADVRAVFDKDIRLFNAQNAEAFSGSAHDGVVLFGVLSPFATKGKDNLRQLVQDYYADHIRVLFRPVNPEFAIIGTSAVAWGSYTITEYPKIGPREAIHGRYTFTYTKMDSKWLLAALHLSPLQGH